MVPVKRYIGRFRKPLHVLKRRAFVRRAVGPILVAVALFLLLRSIVLTHVSIPVDRPDLGLVAGDRILINRMAYSLRLPLQDKLGYAPLSLSQPAAGEMVAFRDEQGELCLGRIIALPGEHDPDTLRCNGVLAPDLYATTCGYTRSENIIGRALCISYSVRPDRVWGLRTDRLFIPLTCAP